MSKLLIMENINMTFNGWKKPEQNWSRLPHEFIENIPKFSSKSELCVVLYVLRHTWGYDDDYKKITLDEFQNGRKRKDGTRIDNGTGMSINAIKAGIKQAIEHGFLSVGRDESDKARIKQYYSLSELDYQKLIPGVSRVDTQPSKVDTRTEKETNRKKLIEREEFAPIGAPPPPSMTNANENHGLNGHSGKSPPPGSDTPPSRKKEPSEHQQLMAAYQDALGYKIRNGAADGKAAKQILDEGYTIQQVIDCYQHMKRDPFWRGSHLSLVSVYKQIGAFVQSQNGNGRIDDIEREWQSIKLAAAQPGRPDISERALRAIQLHVPGGWHTFKQQNVQFFDQLKPIFKEAYERVATNQPATT